MVLGLTIGLVVGLLLGVVVGIVGALGVRGVADALDEADADTRGRAKPLLLERRARLRPDDDAPDTHARCSAVSDLRLVPPRHPRLESHHPFRGPAAKGFHSGFSVGRLHD